MNAPGTGRLVDLWREKLAVAVVSVCLAVLCGRFCAVGFRSADVVSPGIWKTVWRVSVSRSAPG